MATIVDTNVTPIRVLDSVDALEYLDPIYIQSDGSGRLWHSLKKTQIDGKLRPGFLYNPDLSQVRNVDGSAKLPARYWKARGNEVIPMTQQERDAVDLALNPPDLERDAVITILSKADSDITAAEVKRVILRLARKAKDQGMI